MRWQRGGDALPSLTRGLADPGDPSSGALRADVLSRRRRGGGRSPPARRSSLMLLAGPIPDFEPRPRSGPSQRFDCTSRAGRGADIVDRHAGVAVADLISTAQSAASAHSMSSSARPRPAEGCAMGFALNLQALLPFRSVSGQTVRLNRAMQPEACTDALIVSRSWAAVSTEQVCGPFASHAARRLGLAAHP